MSRQEGSFRVCHGTGRPDPAPPSAPGRSASMDLRLAALSLCLGLAWGAPRGDPDLDGHWQLWKSWHNKDYHEVSGPGCVLG